MWSLFLVGFLVTAAQIFGADAERKATGKPATKADFALEIKDNFVSLKATDASLIEVLEEIGRIMNIEVLALLPAHEKISTEFERLPLEEAIKKLSSNYSHLIVSQEGDRKISKIVVLEKGKETALSRPTAQESAMRKEEKPVSKVKAEAVKTEAPQPEPFKFEFDPSKYGEQRR